MENFLEQAFLQGIKVAIADKWIKSIENLLGNPNSDEGINFFSNIEAQFKSNNKSWNSPENYEFSGKNASKLFNLNPNFPKDRLYKFVNLLRECNLTAIDWLRISKNYMMNFVLIVILMMRISTSKKY